MAGSIVVGARIDLADNRHWLMRGFSVAASAPIFGRRPEQSCNLSCPSRSTELSLHCFRPGPQVTILAIARQSISN
jgi:hypothetical protein